MSSRNRTAGAEWDNLRSECDQQASEYDQCRLYITNIPTFLNEEGLEQAFAKFGNLVEFYFSSDPRKRYALAKYDSPGTAKTVINQMNQADPLKLNVSVAKKSKSVGNAKPRYGTGSSTGDYKRYRHETDSVTRGNAERKNRHSDEDTTSVSSRLKDRTDATTHEDLMIRGVDRDSPDEVHKLELQLVQLKLQETQMRLTALKKGKEGGRNVLGDNEREARGARNGTRNDRERGTTSDRNESYGAGAGDSIPPLTRHPSRICVGCFSRPGITLCGRCLVARYCSDECQRRDWVRRHRNICHHLIPIQRSNGGTQSSNGGTQRSNGGTQRSNGGTQRSNGGTQRSNGGTQRSNGGTQRSLPEKMNVATASSVPTAPLIPAAPTQPERNADATATASSSNVAAQRDMKANKPSLVPENCLLDMLSVGDTVMVSVFEGEIRDEVVCLSLSNAYAAGYQKLFDEYVKYCENAQVYVPKPGDTFSLKDTDGDWYRARCLDGVQAALIDVGRVMEYKGLPTKELGAEYESIPEFCCLMDGDGQCVPGDSFSCVVKSRDGSGRVKVSRTRQGIRMTDAVLTRWMPSITHKTVNKNATKRLMMDSLMYIPLPSSGRVKILDSSALESGLLSVCPLDCGVYTNQLMGPISKMINEYCNSEIGSKPYMPRVHELCIAKLLPHDGWFRAVMLEPPVGPRGDTAMVLYMDQGSIGAVKTQHIRKMLREYVDQLPALASSVEIKDFSKDPTPEMMSKACAFLQIPSNNTAGGVVPISNIEEMDPGNYTVTVPALIAAMTRNIST